MALEKAKLDSEASILQDLHLIQARLQKKRNETSNMLEILAQRRIDKSHFKEGKQRND